MRWGVTIGIVGGLLLLMLVGYAVQLFRVCEHCYPDCPLDCFRDDEKEFAWETKWYTVSHEGNRYGVTFHNRRFAKYFMRALEERYGPWNTANILKIKREEEEYVVLSIFFHDHFTPWFYTQGPIKHDEEWIKTDFREICAQVKEELAHKHCCYQFCRRQENACEDHNGDVEAGMSSTAGAVDEAATPLRCSRDLGGASCSSTTQASRRESAVSKATSQARNSNCTHLSTERRCSKPGSACCRASIAVDRPLLMNAQQNQRTVSNKPRHSLRPWTKASFREFRLRNANMASSGGAGDVGTSSDFHAGANLQLDLLPGISVTGDTGLTLPSMCESPCANRTQGFSSSLLTNPVKYSSSQPPAENTIIIHVIEAVVESFGNDKATQTSRQVRVM